MSAIDSTLKRNSVSTASALVAERETRLLSELARAGGELSIGSAAACVGLAERGARKLGERLVRRGLIEHTHGRVHLTAVGWAHPSAADVRAERAVSNVAISEAAALAAERVQLQVAQARTELEELHARELRARRLASQEQWAMDRLERTRDKHWVVDLVDGLDTWDVLRLVGQGRIALADLPAGRKRSLVARAERYLAERQGQPARGLDAVMYAALAATSGDDGEPLPTLSSGGMAALPRPNSSWRSSTVPSLTLEQEEGRRAMDRAAGWQWWAGFAQPPVCCHGNPPGHPNCGCGFPPSWSSSRKPFF